MQYRYKEVTGAILPLEEINNRGRQGSRLVVQTPFSTDMRQWYYLFEETIDIPTETTNNLNVKNIQFNRK